MKVAGVQGWGGGWSITLKTAVPELGISDSRTQTPVLLWKPGMGHTVSQKSSAGTLTVAFGFESVRCSPAPPLHP